MTLARDSSVALPAVLDDILTNGTEVGSRNGRVLEILNARIQLTEPWRREIITPGRKASFPAQIAETMWVLSGRNDIGWLSHYLPRAPEFSDDGYTWRGGYGPRLRSFHGVDQLAYVVDTLQNHRASRQAVVSLWDPQVDTEPGLDRPCNDFLQFQSRLGELHLTVTVRSNDVMWGWSGINAFEWSALQEIVADILGIGVGTLTFNIGSLHLYERHWNKAHNIVNTAPDQLTQALDSTRFKGIKSVEHLDSLLNDWMRLERKIRNGEEVGYAVVNFPKPVMREWLYVLMEYWGRVGTVAPGSRAGIALDRSPQKPHTASEEPAGVSSVLTFAEYVSELHRRKHAAYGDSWKRRGEMLGILANIARKIDRLGVSDDDETAADTAIDLYVYLVKYRLWLSEEAGTPLAIAGEGTSHVEQVSNYIGRTRGNGKGRSLRDREYQLTTMFEHLEHMVKEGNPRRYRIVLEMLDYARANAEARWELSQDEYRGADAD